jgi:ankyrin repeat protein
MPTEETKRRVAEFLRDMQEDLFEFEDCTPMGVNSKGKFDGTPLTVALYRDDLPSVIDLLEMGADPNLNGEDDYSPLHIAVGKDPEFIRVLLAHGAVPQGKNMFGHTPLDVARFHGDPVVIALFEGTPPASPAVE